MWTTVESASYAGTKWSIPSSSSRNERLQIYKIPRINPEILHGSQECEDTVLLYRMPCSTLRGAMFSQLAHTDASPQGGIARSYPKAKAACQKEISLQKTWLLVILISSLVLCWCFFILFLQANSKNVMSDITHTFQELARNYRSVEIHITSWWLLDPTVASWAGVKLGIFFVQI